MPEGVDVISDYNEVAVIDRPAPGSQEEKEVWDDIQARDDEDRVVTGPWHEVFERGQDERDKHAVPGEVVRSLVCRGFAIEFWPSENVALKLLSLRLLSWVFISKFKGRLSMQGV